MYFHKPPRIYILTKKEIDLGIATCPVCGKTMILVPFKKSEKLYRCDNCNFHIEKSFVLTKKLTIDEKLKRIAQTLFDKDFITSEEIKK